jgi:DNA-binding NarL/FixJ family response regulator
MVIDFKEAKSKNQILAGYYASDTFWDELEKVIGERSFYLSPDDHRFAICVLLDIACLRYEQQKKAEEQQQSMTAVVQKMDQLAQENASLRQQLEALGKVDRERGRKIMAMSEREKKAYFMMRDGVKNKLIAKDLGVSEATVSMMKKRFEENGLL